MRKIGENLKKFREGKELSQQELADLLKVPQSTYSRYERSESEVPFSLVMSLVNQFGSDAAEYFVKGAFADLFESAPMETNNIGVMPEHIEEAYKLLYEAVKNAGGDLMGIDPNRAAGVLRIAAREISRPGYSGEVRLHLLREAELILGLVKGS